MNIAKLEKFNEKLAALQEEFSEIVNEIKAEIKAENQKKTKAAMTPEVAVELENLCKFCVIPDPMTLGQLSDYLKKTPLEALTMAIKYKIPVETDGQEVLFPLLGVAQMLAEAKKTD